MSVTKIPLGEIARDVSETVFDKKIKDYKPKIKTLEQVPMNGEGNIEVSASLKKNTLFGTQNTYEIRINVKDNGSPENSSEQPVQNAKPSVTKAKAKRQTFIYSFDETDTEEKPDEEQPKGNEDIDISTLSSLTAASSLGNKTEEKSEEQPNDISSFITVLPSSSLSSNGSLREAMTIDGTNSSLTGASRLSPDGSLSEAMTIDGTNSSRLVPASSLMGDSLVAGHAI